MKFVDGLMIHSGDPVNDYVDSACRHVLLRGCAWNQGQDYVAVRPHRQDWTQEASARQRVDRGAQGGDPAAQPLLIDQGCQARPGPRTCCLNSCLYTLISHFHVLSENTERVLKALDHTSLFQKK